MFLTSMAGNPLCIGLAATAVGVEITWMNWAVAAIVPGLISLFLVPVLMLKLSPPEIRDILDARDLAINELEKMGPMSLQEKVLAFVFVMCLALWATGSWTKLGATPVAMLAVAIMLIAKVLDWKDILSEKGAWDAMFWMGGLVVLATALAKSGFIAWIAKLIGTAVAAACGVPAMLVAITFGCFANLPISLTHYGNGCGPVYFGAGYVSQGEWWRNGFIITTINVVIWLTIGMTWWKFIGLY
jgi:DASS family divalent anion:Na+ symporter